MHFFIRLKVLLRVVSNTNDKKPVFKMMDHSTTVFINDKILFPFQKIPRWLTIECMHSTQLSLYRYYICESHQHLQSIEHFHVLIHKTFIQHCVNTYPFENRIRIHLVTLANIHCIHISLGAHRSTMYLCIYCV